MAIRILHEKQGFTLLEVLVTIAIILILSAASIPAVQGLLPSIRLNTSVISVKRELLVARTHAISDTKIHTGVFFDTASTPQRMIVFLDTNANYQYDSTIDRQYGPIVVFPDDARMSLNAIVNKCIVYRGDGSLRSGYGGSVVCKAVRAKNKQKTILVSSSGRIKVTTP